MAEEKKMTDFHEGDRVEFRCLGYVRNVTAASVHVSLDGLNFAADIPVSPRMLTKLSEAREMTSLHDETQRGAYPRASSPSSHHAT